MTYGTLQAFKRCAPLCTYKSAVQSAAAMDRMPEIAWKQMIDNAVVLDTVRVYLPSPAQELERVLAEDGEAWRTNRPAISACWRPANPLGRSKAGKRESSSAYGRRRRAANRSTLSLPVVPPLRS